MAKTVPASYVPVDGIEFRTRRPIRSTDWAALASAQNLMYSQRGERVGGMCFYDAPWENNTATFASNSTNALTLKSLNDWIPVLRAQKIVSELTLSAVQFDVHVFGSDYQFRVEAVDGDDGITVYDTVIVTNATATRQWSVGTINLKETEIKRADGTPRPIIFVVAACRNTTLAKIHQFHIRSSPLLASELPEREYLWERYPFSGTFTPCGKTGYLGPLQADIDASYVAGNSLYQQVTSIDQGIQVWEVPFDGIWEIEAAGAGFDGVANQRGATAIGEFNFQRGTQLRIAVGQVGSNIRCGSGGSFVAAYDRPLTSTDIMAIDSVKVVPLVVGGGAGGTLTANVADIGGQAGNAGANASTGTAGGINGLGGAGVGFAVGGAGFRGNGGGADGVAPNNVTRSFLNGAEGNLAADAGITPGSFGGGGTGRLGTNYRFGGGGGFGGGGAANTTAATGWGGGGGSYVNTTDYGGAQISITAANNIGDGYVTIRYVGQ